MLLLDFDFYSLTTVIYFFLKSALDRTMTSGMVAYICCHMKQYRFQICTWIHYEHHFALVDSVSILHLILIVKI